MDRGCEHYCHLRKRILPPQHVYVVAPVVVDVNAGATTACEGACVSMAVVGVGAGVAIVGVAVVAIAVVVVGFVRAVEMYAAGYLSLEIVVDVKFALETELAVVAAAECVGGKVDVDPVDGAALIYVLFAFEFDHLY